MLGAVIGGEEGVVCTPESQFKEEIVKGAVLKAGLAHKADSDKTIRDLNQHYRLIHWGLDPIRYRIPQPLTPRRVRGFFEMLVQEYAALHGQLAPRVWVDHTPNNMVFHKYLSQVFADSRFIHIVRDGRAVAASLIKLDWGPFGIIEAAEFWLRNLAFGLYAETSDPKATRVYYEDLVNCNYGGLNDALAGYICPDGPDELSWGTPRFDVPEYTRHQHEAVGREADPRRSDAWTRELSERQVEIFESIAGEMLVGLGYELQFPNSQVGPGKGERLQELLATEIIYKRISRLKRAIRIYRTSKLVV